MKHSFRNVLNVLIVSFLYLWSTELKLDPSTGSGRQSETLRLGFTFKLSQTWIFVFQHNISCLRLIWIHSKHFNYLKYKMQYEI